MLDRTRLSTNTLPPPWLHKGRSETIQLARPNCWDCRAFLDSGGVSSIVGRRKSTGLCLSTLSTLSRTRRKSLSHGRALPRTTRHDRQHPTTTDLQPDLEQDAPKLLRTIPAERLHQYQELNRYELLPTSNSGNAMDLGRQLALGRYRYHCAIPQGLTALTYRCWTQC